MLKCYFLDDEQDAIDALVAMMKKKFQGKVQIVGYNINATIALTEIDQLQPDVLFLDIEMPSMNGLDVLRHFPNRNFYVIFTTAHEKYALPAIKLEATDYLVKPLSPQDVFDALQKCEHKKSIEPHFVENNKLNLFTKSGTTIINIFDIIYIEAENTYSIFHLTNQPKITISKTLKSVEEQLLGNKFFRVHQSYLVNLNHLLSLKSKDGDFVLLTNNHKVEVSRRRKPELLQILRKH